MKKGVKTISEKFWKKIDIFLLILFPVLATIISLLFKTSIFISIILFFGLPSIYLSYRTKHMVKKTLLFSLIVSISSTVIIDYFLTFNKIWFVSTIFPFRLPLGIPLEDPIWFFLFPFSVILFYEHFLDKGKHELIDKKMKYFIWPLLIITLILLLLFVVNPLLLKVRYAYLWIGIILILFPLVTFLSAFPRLLSKYVKTATYFFALNLMYELVAMKLNQWTWPSNSEYIGMVQLFGLSFPFEEFFFYIVLATTALLSYYEFFDDDRK